MLFIKSFNREIIDHASCGDENISKLDHRILLSQLNETYQEPSAGAVLQTAPLNFGNVSRFHWLPWIHLQLKKPQFTENSKSSPQFGSTFEASRFFPVTASDCMIPEYNSFLPPLLALI